jgi:hypothetical protein
LHVILVFVLLVEEALVSRIDCGGWQSELVVAVWNCVLHPEQEFVHIHPRQSAQVVN